MSNLFPPEFVVQIRTANPIAELISEYLPLKKRGRNYFGLCPFHVEKTPSFSVNPEKQIYHCFGCGQGGNAISFLMEHDKLGFVEAVKLLARRANIPLPKKEGSPGQMELNDRLYQVHQIATGHYKNELNRNIGQRALEYLKERGVSEKTCREFEIGYAGPEWDGLLKYATSLGISLETLTLSGLVIPRNDGQGHFDRFRNRIIFPIFSLSGRVAAFAGRILDPQDSPKYMNSPESPIYQKGKLLYGLHLSKESAKDKREIVLVEGYLDFVSLYQVGITNLAATCGTAFSFEQARLLARFADTAILFFDSDSAGQKAVLRSVDALYDAGVDVKVASLPSGFDPDSFVRKEGAASVAKLLDGAAGFIRFKIASLESKFSSLGFRKQEEVISDFAQTASRIADGIRRELFISQVCAELGVNESLFKAGLKKLSAQREGSPDRATPATEKRNAVGWEQEFLGLLIDRPEWFKQAEGVVSQDMFSTPPTSEMWKLFSNFYQTNTHLDLSELLEAGNASQRRLLLELANLNTNRNADPNVLQDYLNRFKLRQRDGEVKKLKNLLREAEDNKDQEKSQELSEQIAARLKS